MGFSRQEYWSGLPFPSPGDLPDSGIKPRSPALQTASLPCEPPGEPLTYLGALQKKKKAIIFGFSLNIYHIRTSALNLRVNRSSKSKDIFMESCYVLSGYHPPQFTYEVKTQKTLVRFPGSHTARQDQREVHTQVTAPPRTVSLHQV